MTMAARSREAVEIEGLAPTGRNCANSPMKVSYEQQVIGESSTVLQSFLELIVPFGRAAALQSRIDALSSTTPVCIVRRTCKYMYV